MPTAEKIHALKKKTPVKAETRQQILELLDTGKYTFREIGDKLQCNYALVGQVKQWAERRDGLHGLSLRDQTTSTKIEGQIVRALRSAIRRIGETTTDPVTGNVVKQSASDFRAFCAGVGLLIDKARLLAEKSTSNIQSKSLAVAVVRRAGKPKEDVA